MSQSSSTPAHGSASKTHTPPVKMSKTYAIIGGLFLFVVALAAITIAWMNKQNKKTDPFSFSSSSNGDQVKTGKTVMYDTYPTIEPNTFDINGEFSEKKVIPDGYYISFVCDQPYEVRKANGDTVQSQANKKAIIGLKDNHESTENSVLEFRTTNASATKMTIIFTPMKTIE